MSLRVRLRPLTPSDVRGLERRERRHRERLRRAGCRSRVAVDTSGCFGVVLVEEEGTGRFGFLDGDGRVRWLDEARGIGALAPAVAGGVLFEPEVGRTGARRGRRRRSGQ